LIVPVALVENVSMSVIATVVLIGVETAGLYI